MDDSRCCFERIYTKSRDIKTLSISRGLIYLTRSLGISYFLLFFVNEIPQKPGFDYW